MVAGRRCVVVGSAPLAAPIVAAEDECIVAVNGGISSYPRCDVWILNARTASDPATLGRLKPLHRLMITQGTARDVDLLLLLTKSDGAREQTLAKLKAQGTRWRTVAELPNEQRRALETRAGARTAGMAKQALSAGMTAAALCLDAQAAQVRLEGFSWSPGYAYLPGEATGMNRGHEAGDTRALALLTRRYPGRLLHSLTKD